ncbi:Retrovirus-related Pol polyprotein from transposon TNT 1-94 [Gossypium australe]|uniref:Retrovirus-related Pol polyprotein from transposon TNT 1-94 n=1 Tax=Gossypium australe TaxID=47621 RepID=A0A5B6W723_9ROSI|nr:Retrovirus-related Pol polyprotein from transposon TNT 1-94 [Gossypium australe]
MILTQFGMSIKVFRSDNEREYLNQELKEFMGSVVMVHQTTCLYLSRKCSILLIALSSAIYVTNCTPSSTLNYQQPLDVLFDHCSLPPVVHLPPKIFVCVVYIHLYPHQRNKLESQVVKCIFVGYGNYQKGYKCYDPSSKRFHVTMDVVFNENEFFYSTDSLLQGEKHNEVINLDDAV